MAASGRITINHLKGRPNNVADESEQHNKGESLTHLMSVENDLSLASASVPTIAAATVGASVASVTPSKVVAKKCGKASVLCVI